MFSINAFIFYVRPTFPVLVLRQCSYVIQRTGSDVTAFDETLPTSFDENNNNIIIIIRPALQQEDQ